ncbi:alpha/beta-hydrolase [Hesseltinella vesiculosa]|uniref:Alpha/beta-hydrolase n=1 Tax=Hesseltinella vesiculosa TaxID=101127 RepID=A0A1X2G8S9_9FUNG|nr:alpha/beta-hydrolase [Hesseltinella vesiculosa]
MSYYPKIHPAYQPIVDGLVETVAVKNIDLKSVDVDEIREICDYVPENHGLQIPDVISDEHTITAAGYSVKLYTYRPLGSEDKMIPAVIYLHGGGWLFFTHKNYDRAMKDITVKANVATVFVEYVLSPTAKFPDPVTQCYESILWIHENAAKLNLDADRLVLVGDSLGSNMATSIPIMLNENQLGNIVKGVVMLYPDIDPTNRDNHESYELLGKGDFGFKAEDMLFNLPHTLPDFPTIPADFRLSLTNATDDQLKGLPPFLIVTAETDMYRGPGEDFAQRLMNNGVDVAAVRLMGAVHGYLAYYVECAPYRRTIGFIASFVNDLV